MGFNLVKFCVEKPVRIFRHMKQHNFSTNTMVLKTFQSKGPFHFIYHRNTYINEHDSGAKKRNGTVIFQAFDLGGKKEKLRIPLNEFNFHFFPKTSLREGLFKLILFVSVSPEQLVSRTYKKRFRCLSNGARA